MVTGPAAAAEASIGIDAVSVKTASAVITCTFVDICTCYRHTYPIGVCALAVQNNQLIMPVSLSLRSRIPDNRLCRGLYIILEWPRVYLTISIKVFHFQ